ncbi:MAG: hypothetical protein ACK5PQ_01815 [Alphaproteobacteria bacterium]
MRAWGVWFNILWTSSSEDGCSLLAIKATGEPFLAVSIKKLSSPWLDPVALALIPLNNAAKITHLTFDLSILKLFCAYLMIIYQIPIAFKARLFNTERKTIN